MKDNMDKLLENAFVPEYEPAPELNAKIIAQSRQKQGKAKKNIVMQLPKVAAIVIALGCITPIGVYATDYLINNVFVTEHGISVGQTEYVDDAELAKPWEEVEVEPVSNEQGGPNDKWSEKKVEKIGSVTNTYYTYETYETALEESGLDNWFNTTYEGDGYVTYVHLKDADFEQMEIGAFFYVGEKMFSVSEIKRPGVNHMEGTHSLALAKTGNKRTYTAKSGKEYVLVDETAGEHEGTTYVVIAYGEYFGYLSFDAMTDEEIHQILDTVVVPKEQNTQEQTAQE